MKEASQLTAANCSRCCLQWILPDLLHRRKGFSVFSSSFKARTTVLPHDYGLELSTLARKAVPFFVNKFAGFVSVRLEIGQIMFDSLSNQPGLSDTDNSLRSQSKETLQAVTKVQELKVQIQIETPYSRRPPKLIGKPPQKSQRTSKEKIASSSAAGQRMPSCSGSFTSRDKFKSYGKGSDPPPAVEGTYMDQKQGEGDLEQRHIRDRLKQFKKERSKSYPSQRRSSSKKQERDNAAERHSGGDSLENFLTHEDGPKAESEGFVSPKSPTGNPSRSKPSFIELADNILTAIFNSFDKIDSSKEKIIDRSEFLSALERLPVMAEHGQDVVVRIPEGEKTLGDILQVIEEDGDEQEHLTLAQLLDYFYFNYIPPEEGDKNEDILNKVLLEVGDLYVLYSVFSKSEFDKLENEANTSIFVKTLLEDPAHAKFLEKTAREPMGVSKFPAETVGDLLKRIQSTEGEKLNWNILLAYLTTEGEPHHVVTLQAESSEEAVEEEEGRSEQVNETESSIESKESFGNKKFLTIPKGPMLLERRSSPKDSIIAKRVQAMIKEKEEKEMAEQNKKIKANGVDPEILKPKFEKLQEEDENRRAEALQKAQEKAKKDSCPPGVAFKSMKRTSQVQSDPKFEFRAREVPESVSEEKMPKLQRENEEKKQKRHSRAKDLLKSAQLPPRMEAAISKPKASIQDPFKPLINKNRSAPNLLHLHDQAKSKFTDALETKETTVPVSFSSDTLRKHRFQSKFTSIQEEPLRLSTFSENSEKREAETVLNEMKAHSIEKEQRREYQTEIDQVFTTKTDPRKEKLEEDFDEIWGPFTK